MARVAGGIAGWLIGLLPLLAVNVAAYLGTFSADDAIFAGELTLVGGLLLGGIIAGVIGARPTRTQPGGVTGAFISGGIAALLYAVTLVGLVIGASLLGVAPGVVGEHPIRVSAAVLFLAALLAAIAVAAGMIAGRFSHAPRLQRSSAPRRQSQPTSRPQAPQPKSVPLSRYGNVFDRDEQASPRQGHERRTRPLSDYRDSPPRTPPPTQPRYREGQPVHPPAPTRPSAGQWQQRDYQYPPQDDRRH
jgi:positive regulator of sigma E activity